MKLKNFKLFLPTLALSIYASPGYAECARDDINFYLGKGFTPEQITAICTTASGKPANNESINNTEQQGAEKLSDEELSTEEITETNTGQTTSLKKNEQFLKEAINGRNILLSNDSLQYSLKTCYNYGEEDQYGFAPKACPIVKFVIALKGLEVTRSGKKYIFFGDHEIEVKSKKITREITAGLEEHKPEEQQQIQKHLESGDQTIIPIRDDISLTDVEQVLLQLSR